MACQLDPRCRLLCRADLAPKAITHRMEGEAVWHSGRLLTKQLITITPLVGIPPGFMEETPAPHSSSCGQGNIVGAGGGVRFQQLGLFCPHACRFRGILAKFWALETHRQGGKGSYFDRVTLVVSQQRGQQDRGNISGHSDSSDYSDHICAIQRRPPSTLCVTSIGPVLWLLLRCFDDYLTCGQWSPMM